MAMPIPIRNYRPSGRRQRQRGVALFVVLVLVMLAMLLALWASRSAFFNQLVVGNDADYQRAFAAAQAMLQDAEFDVLRQKPDGGVCARVAATPKVCRSPVSGIVVRLIAQPGQNLQVGDPLMVLEAMKMETNITAPIAGRIAALRVAQGDNVQSGQIVVEFE